MFGVGAKIKSHHNVGGLPDYVDFEEIIEPLRDLFKDEVRAVGSELGLPDYLVNRQPFPGPGLAIRLICHDKNDEVIISEEEVNKLAEILTGTNLNGYILPIKSVGVQGDARSYRNLCLFAGNKFDFNWNELTVKAKEVTDNIHTINRVGYILNKEKFDGNIECFDMRIEDENVDLLREIDYIVTSNLKDAKVSQTFAVLIPIGINKKYSIGIRTFVTNDFMTGRPGEIGKEVSAEKIKLIVDEIEKRFGNQIEFVIYDITSKPPATTEWQ